jgi:hypothetical protein
MSKVVSTPGLIRACRNARKKGFNRLLTNLEAGALDPAGFHVLGQSFVHGDAQCVRCVTALLKVRGCAEPAETVLDFTFEDWNAFKDAGAVKERIQEAMKGGRDE